MDFIRKNMTLVLGILVIGGGLYVYMTYFSKPVGEALVSSESNSPVSQDTLAVLASLHVIKLDTSIFSSPAFESLTSFGVQLTPENVGRRNPFLPVGSQ